MSNNLFQVSLHLFLQNHLSKIWKQWFQQKRKFHKLIKISENIFYNYNNQFPLRNLQHKEHATKKKEIPISNQQSQSNNKAPIQESKQKVDQSLKETNFLVQKKDANFVQGKKYTEDEVNNKLQEKGYKDLLDEKNGNFDVGKIIRIKKN